MDKHDQGRQQEGLPIGRDVVGWVIEAPASTIADMA